MKLFYLGDWEDSWLLGIVGKWQFLNIIMTLVFIDGKSEAHKGRVTS